MYYQSFSPTAYGAQSQAVYGGGFGNTGGGQSGFLGMSGGQWAQIGLQAASMYAQGRAQGEENEETRQHDRDMAELQFELAERGRTNEIGRRRDAFSQFNGMQRTNPFAGLGSSFLPQTNYTPYAQNPLLGG